MSDLSFLFTLRAILNSGDDWLELGVFFLLKQLIAFNLNAHRLQVPNWGVFLRH